MMVMVVNNNKGDTYGLRTSPSASPNSWPVFKFQYWSKRAVNVRDKTIPHSDKPAAAGAGHQEQSINQIGRV